MSDVFAEMEKILQNDTIERHTFYQLRFFVLGAEPTIQAKLQCCLRELRSRRMTIASVNREVEELNDQNQILTMQIEKIANEFPTDSGGIELTDQEDIERFEKERSLEMRGLMRKKTANEWQVFELQRKLRFLIEECQFFVSAFHQLRAEEPLKNWDSIEVQKEYWDAKLGHEFRTRLILGQPLDSELVKAIEELHDEAHTKKSIQQLMQQQEKFNRDNGIPMPEASVAIEDELKDS